MKKIKFLFVIYFQIIIQNHLVAKSNFNNIILPRIIVNTNLYKISSKEKTNAKIKLNYFFHRIKKKKELDEWTEAKIKLRGNSSKYFAKKQYSIFFEDLKGQSSKLSLIHGSASKKWVLNGPYVDRSYIRNDIAYTVGRKIGEKKNQYFAPKTDFVELVINNQYLGLYVLTEKIERSKYKINIDKYKKLQQTKNPISFIAEISRGDGDFKTKNDVEIKMEYPDSKQIQNLENNDPKYAAALDKEIKKSIESFEDIIFSKKINRYFLDDQNNIFDPESFLDYIIIQEVFKNPDGYRRSAYFHRNTDGVIFMGPIWDFNIAMGNLSYYGTSQKKGWIFKKNFQLIKSARWFKEIMSNPVPKKLLIKRYKELRNPGEALDLKFIEEAIMKSYNKIKDYAVINQSIWGHKESILDYRILTTHFKWQNHHEHIQALILWLKERIMWIDNNIDYI